MLLTSPGHNHGRQAADKQSQVWWWLELATASYFQGAAMTEVGKELQ